MGTDPMAHARTVRVPTAKADLSGTATLTRTMLHDKATHVEEPCAVKIASTVLKPSGGSDTFA